MPPLHAAPLVSASYDAPLHVWRSHVLRRPFDRAKATVAPHLRHRNSPQLCPASIGLPRHPAWTRRNVPAVWCFWPVHTFGADGPHPSGSPRVRATPVKQRSCNSSSIGVIVKSSLHTSTKTYCHPWPEVSHRAGRGITLPKAIFPTTSPFARPREPIACLAILRKTTPVFYKSSISPT
jgi:hypothetical protein